MTVQVDIEVGVHCLCKGSNYSVTIPSSKLPLAASACHCDSCRHLTGGMYTCAIEWPGSAEDILASPLQKYKYSNGSQILFCKSCGTPMFAQKLCSAQSPDVFYLPVGLLPNLDVDLVKIVQHLWVGDTRDGGASVFMQNLCPATGLTPRWQANRGSNLLDRSWPAEASTNSPASDTVSVQCHCKGVDFLLHRGEAGFRQLLAQGKLPGWINPATFKPIAAYDACDSCRFMTGVPLMHWTFARVSQLGFAAENKDAREFPTNTLDLKTAVQTASDSRFGTLTFYASSPDVQRYYCSRCSASVFYAVDDLPDQVDISMGLLHASEGARAESWVEWEYGGLGHKGDTLGGWREDFGEAIRGESEVWRLSRGIPKGHRFK